MAKKGKLNPQFPKIYRIITEKSGLPLILGSAAFLMVLIFILLFQFSVNYEQYLKLSSERQKIIGKVNFWSSALDKFPGFADASFNIAVLYYELGDLKNSRLYLEKTLVFDPNYKLAQDLSKELLKKGY